MFPELTFIKSLIQPSDLSPILNLATEVSGSLSLAGDLALNSNQTNGQARLDLTDFGFTINDIPFQNVNLALEMDQLAPPRSRPGQRLTAAEIDPGVPLRDVSAQFQLLPGTPVKLKVEQATFDALAGRFRLRDTVIDPAAERQEATLEVLDLDLAELLRLYPVEGLTATGLLKGQVPFRIDSGQVAIGEAELAAQGPGLLQFRSPGAQQALASGGEPVELMLQALEDFQYETLSVTAVKDLDHNTELRIEILGNNPNVFRWLPV